MNNNVKIYSMFLVFGLFLFSCEKDQDAMLTQLEVMKEQFTPSYTSIAVECQLNTSASIKDVYVQYATSQDFADYQVEEMQKKDEKYTTNLSDLEDNTTYYIRYVASNQYSTGTTKDISTATTLTLSIPTINLISVTDIWDKSAKAQIKLVHEGGADVTQQGVCWSTKKGPTLDNGSHMESKDQQTIIPISNLQANTAYYLRAYAVNRKGIGYSEQEISFTTLALPVVQTNEITDIQLTTALLNGNLIFNGNDSTTIKGFCWSEQSAPTINNNQIQITTNSNNFNYQVSNLKDETKYYVRAYAKNKIGIAYGDERAFTTSSAIKPTITTSSITDITYTSAKIGGNVTSDGGATVTERGVCYSISSNPTISNNKASSGSGIGSFTANLTGLSDGTTYYVRAYATNKKGTSYGEQKSFTTNAYLKPTVTTSTATNISYTTATIGGNVTSDGGATVTERGVVYSTSQNPTTLNSKKVSGSGIGTFSVNLTGLTNGTTYYVRAYAINKKGTNYGSQVSFTTVSYTTPNVTTTSANNISDITATVGGNITSDGGLNVTERGVVYSTSQNPTTASNKVSSGSGLGVFSVTLSNLQEGTTYYVRAFAQNSKGTSYGSQVSFTTKQFFLPEVTTSSVMNISYTSATICGNVTSDGGTAIIERGVVYSTTQNPTTSSSKMISGSGTGTFTCNLTNLHESTTYYARAYAVNKKGTSYGEEVSFTTGVIDMSFSISTSKKVTFSPGNLQFHPSNKIWRFAENQTDYIGEANRNISATYNGWLDLFGWGTGNNPINTSGNSSDYQTFVDWGVNQINNDNPNTWRTLTASEWDFLLNTRSNAKYLKGMAQVKGVNGLILLPDNWNCPDDVDFDYRFGNSYDEVQKFNAYTWSKFEQSGAVFLPAAGYRSGVNVGYVGYEGYYWTSTKTDYWVQYFGFESSSANVIMGIDMCARGYSIRLVKDL